MRYRVACFFLAVNLLSGCTRNHLYVQKEWIDRNYLASSHVHTPDFRQEHPPTGDQLLVSWDFPKSVFEQKLTLEATVRFWNEKEETFCRTLKRKRGYEVLFFPHDEPDTDQRILTYLIRVVSAKGEVVGYWEHQFWTQLIEVGERRSTVSSQERQASVIETP